ncbi:sugar ABC transporter permease [Bacillus infantis]|uniref:ABC transporter permease n=1 Tax=Bacillus infantis TaxID=324767 RepID=UPI00101CB101|nr:ABC transporter permease subunit [Bacillus infantis]RYI30395.1 sugar ABC transporter permease [Bacillus infantis]
MANTALEKEQKVIAVSRKSRFLKKLYNQRYLYFMMLPAFILVFVFNYVTLAGWMLAFKNYQAGLGLWDSPWIGLYHFKSFFVEGKEYLYLLRNTLAMNVSVIVINLTVALTFAVLLNEIRNKKFTKVIQTLSIFPYFVSWVIVYSIMHALFSVSSGAINETLMELGIISKGINILGDEEFSWGLIIAIQLWKYLGYNGVLFIASIASIPSEQYEAAEIDGANRYAKIFYITIPNLMPTLIVLLIMNIGWVLNSDFDLFYLFTNPTNLERMEVLDMYIYRYGLQLGNYSYATAVGIIKSIVSVLLVLSANYLSKKFTSKSIL